MQSVLHGIVNYWSLHFILPKKVVHAIENKCLAFLWSSSNSSKRAKVNWAQIRTLKNEGSLGLKRIEEWNKACVSRVIFAGSESLWIAWVHKHLLKDKRFWTIDIKSGSSWTWRKIPRFRDTGRKLIKYIVGNGAKIFVWHYCWHTKDPLLLT